MLGLKRRPSALISAFPFFPFISTSFLYNSSTGVINLDISTSSSVRFPSPLIDRLKVSASDLGLSHPICLCSTRVQHRCAFTVQLRGVVDVVGLQVAVKGSSIWGCSTHSPTKKVLELKKRPLSANNQGICKFAHSFSTCWSCYECFILIFFKLQLWCSSWR